MADFFCGSGTTLRVAERLGRRWIGCDLGKVGIQVTRATLVEQDARPFLLENIGNYQREMIYLSGHTIHEIQNVVLRLYGAEPRGDLRGYGIREKTLIFVGWPDRPMTARKVEELAKEAAILDGRGYGELVVLGWDYEYNFDELWEARKKNVPEGVTVTPKTIPPEIYDYLKKAKSEEDLEALHGKIRFHEKPYLKIKCAQGKRNAESKTTKITIALDRYCIFDMPVEKEDDREELRNLQAENFAVFVDYWAVDTDYDGHTFRSRWQAVRGNGKRAKTVPVEAEFELPMGNKHRIAVRVVDIFGNDASAEAEADLRWKK